MLRVVFTQPASFARALSLAWKMSRHAERPLTVHLIYFAEACQIQLWLQAADIQHLHAHFGTNSAEVAMFVHALGGPPWSFTVHGPEEFDKAPLIGLSEKIRRCSFVVAISSFGRSQLFRMVEHGYWHKVKVVHCGLEPPFFSGNAVAQPGSRRLICVGRLCEQKGQLLLIEAARLLSERGTDFELVLAGDGELRPEIDALIARYKLRSKIRVTGWVSGLQIRNELLASRALVLPSFAEGLPVAIMEAMALGIPVISTFVAGIPELVHAGEHGWLVPAGDVDALANAMQGCLDASDDTIKSFGDAAAIRARSRHNIEQEAAKLAALFRSA
jgi:glycosyltransferase involved in cell wall biosynthesis